MRPADVRWYASGGGIARCGPFASQITAHLAMRLSESAQREQRETHGTDSPYPHDLVVWSEPTPVEEEEDA